MNFISGHSDKLGCDYVFHLGFELGQLGRDLQAAILDHWKLLDPTIRVEFIGAEHGLGLMNSAGAGVGVHCLAARLATRPYTPKTVSSKPRKEGKEDKTH
jgi:hypothetical protein